jgi:hypothetical protein
MKYKIIELLGGIPFFLMSLEGKSMPNKTRIFEAIIIGFMVSILTTTAVTVFALPMALNELKLKLGYMENSNLRMVNDINKVCDVVMVIDKKVAAMDALQQERILRERYNDSRGK